jgi:hypothetical protein
MRIESLRIFQTPGLGHDERMEARVEATPAAMARWPTASSHASD